MLVVGAFYGRAGGLIAVGLIAALVTAGATAAHEVDAGKIDESPTLAADVDDTYDLFAGKIDLDLSNVRDIENLDGRHIDVEAVFGQIVVTVPDGVDVEVDASVDGGETRLFGDNESSSNSARHSARTVGAPVNDHRHRARVRRDHRGHRREDRPMTDTTVTETAERESGRHPVNVGHLVMGVALLGLVAIWALIVGDVVEGEDVRWLLPVPWVLAGAAGLIALAVTGHRGRETRQVGWVAPPEQTEPPRPTRAPDRDPGRPDRAPQRGEPMNTEQSRKRLVRNTNDKVLGGVCAGVADYLGVDVTLVRVLTVVGAVFGLGTLVVAYVVAWAVMPSA